MELCIHMPKSSTSSTSSNFSPPFCFQTFCFSFHSALLYIKLHSPGLGPLDECFFVSLHFTGLCLILHYSCGLVPRSSHLDHLDHLGFGGPPKKSNFGLGGGDFRHFFDRDPPFPLKYGEEVFLKFKSFFAHFCRFLVSKHFQNC